MRSKSLSVGLAVTTVAAALVAILTSCGEDGSVSGGGGGWSSGGAAGNVIPIGDDTGLGAWGLPEGFTPGLKGGFKLGNLVGSGGMPGADDGGAGQGAGGCGMIVTGVVRDFKGYDDGGPHAGHPDFENWCCGDDRGLVADLIGAERKPVYTAHSSKSTHGQPSFDQWYRTVDGVNMAYYLQIALEPTDDARKIATFHSNAFFPVDGVGFGNFGRDHNFHFTTELHLQFRYNGGETFMFTGDDDVFVFINEHLAIDLGGVHGAEDQAIDLDSQATAFGISTGNIYDLDLFHAERHTTESNFRIDTTMEFVSCGLIVGPH